MSTFASTFLSSNVGNLTTLKSELENELPARTFVTTGGSTSMASATYAQLVSQSVTLEVDEVALIWSLAVVSAGTTGEQVALINYQDAASLSNQVLWTETSGSTSGQRMCLVTFTKVQDVTGTVALKTMWARNSGSGTIYAYGALQMIQVVKRRS